MLIELSVFAVDRSMTQDSTPQSLALSPTTGLTVHYAWCLEGGILLRIQYLQKCCLRHDKVRVPNKISFGRKHPLPPLAFTGRLFSLLETQLLGNASVAFQKYLIGCQAFQGVQSAACGLNIEFCEVLSTWLSSCTVILSVMTSITLGIFAQKSSDQ